VETIILTVLRRSMLRVLIGLSLHHSTNQGKTAKLHIDIELAEN